MSLDSFNSILDFSRIRVGVTFLLLFVFPSDFAFFLSGFALDREVFLEIWVVEMRADTYDYERVVGTLAPSSSL